jgi:hypothetical protein
MDVLKTIKRKLRKEKITLEKRLAQISSVLSAMNGSKPRRRRLSARARRKIAAAQRKRWRKAKKSSARN